ncbi:MAG: NADPH:quinone reductase [Armatimonadetes bacterium]|nr:NADPH:quinone reductase [Armatimonadota bacterium]
MRAIRVHEFGEPEVLRIEEVPDPQPGPGQVVVRVRAAGVNPVDTYIRFGSYANKPELPYTPGSDGAGTVEAVGEEVRRVAAGDRVYLAGTLSGSYAEFALCRESQVHPLPERVSFEQGAGVHVPYATAYYGLYHRAHALPGETVLVHGATGGVGTAAVQIAHAAGMRVIGTGGTDKGRVMVREQGADHVLDHHSEGYLDRIPEITGGKGVDVVLEMAAHLNLDKDLSVVAKKGRIVVIGSRGRIEIDPRLAMRSDAAVLGLLLFNASEKEQESIHAALVAGLSNGTLQPVVGQSIPLKDAPRAHRDVMEPGAYGNIVLIP